MRDSCCRLPRPGPLRRDRRSRAAHALALALRAALRRASARRDFQLVGAAHLAMLTDAHSSSACARAIQRLRQRRASTSRPPSTPSRAASATSRPTCTVPGGTEPLRRALDARRGRGHLLPLDRPAALRPASHCAGQAGSSMRRAASCSRSRSAPTRQPAREVERGGRRGLRREPGLPHRPLPRQGTGAEPAGAALRQRDLRAAVELIAIDHVQITVAETVGVEGRWRVLRRIPVRCATWCRATCCSCSAWWRWSRRRASRRRRCATRR